MHWAKNSSLGSPENSLWANPACHIALRRWKWRDLSSHIKQPHCHHTRLSILRSWRLRNCWAWVIGGIPLSLLCGNNRPAGTECGPQHQMVVLLFQLSRFSCFFPFLKQVFKHGLVCVWGSVTSVEKGTEFFGLYARSRLVWSFLILIGQ